jgi:plastocyanin
MTCDSPAKSVTIKLTARGFDFNGYANGKMTMSVPQGWKVAVQFTNQAPTPHSAVIVSGPDATTPAFSGAGTPDPVSGTPPGQSASFTFTADKTGSYRIACLVPGHQASGMWDTFQITSGGSPSVSTS